MGCDYFANENGEFKLDIRDINGNVVGQVLLTDLEAEAPLYHDLKVGRDR